MKDLVRGLVAMVRSPRQGLQIRVVRQFIKFSIVGVVNTATSITVYTVTTRPFGLDPLIGNAIAFTVAVTVSFTLNKLWTFRDRVRRYVRQYTTFLAVSGVGLLISESIILLVHKILGFHDYVAFFTAIAVVVFWNFNANRAWTFPESTELR